MGPFMDLPSPPLESLNLHDVSTANLSAVVTFNSPLLPSTTQRCSPLSLSTIHPTDQATSHIPSEQPICQHCSTPRDFQDTVLTRFYPSPPRTGSALKQSIPLPVFPPPVGMDCTHHRTAQTSESESTSYDESSASQPDSSPSALRIVTPEIHKEVSYVTTHHEPLSPPPTLALSVLELPPADLSGPTHAPGLPSPESPRRDHGEHFHKRHKRLRLHGEYDPQIGPSRSNTVGGGALASDDSQLSPLTASPDGAWGTQSRLSDESYTAYSPYDHDDGHSLQWSSPMDWSSTSSLFQDDDLDKDMPPSSPRHKLSPLDVPSLEDSRGQPFVDSFNHGPHPQSYPSRPTIFPPDDDGHPPPLPWGTPSSSSYSDISTDGIHIPPSSPRSRLLHLPMSDPDSDVSFADTVMPLEDEEDEDSCDDTPQPHSPIPRQFQPLPDFDSYDESTYLTPVPRSPRARPALLPLFGDSYEPPPAPSSPHRELPILPEDEFDYPEPSYQDRSSSPSGSIAVQPPLESEGLGLFIRSIDPPLARTPSPTEDDFGFLDIQLDPLSSDLPVDEFLALRRMRKQALEFEQNARKREEALSEKVTAAACALLPLGASASSSSSTPLEPIDPHFKRARKHELHLAMDARSEVRKQRKRSKQKSKEIGALMDFKMNRNSLIETGVDVGKGLRHLIANMVIGRRDASTRALGGRKGASGEKKFVKTKLWASVSSEDLLEGFESESSYGHDEEMGCGGGEAESRSEEEMDVDE